MSVILILALRKTVVISNRCSSYIVYVRHVKQHNDNTIFEYGLLNKTMKDT